ncbi:TetR/AcrR family transcriptional regulator [Nocardioides mesophilus]|uniref:TetR/AcrR family transcriptional regulator C-terminal domain-containing protein n=1 Tax=Nocardioides mesophilus TaxID=433659 RepID=A0A7G9R6F2_9ACTN|nr:TetR/AcrR family transcriptional regulator C-terminal domain-containing protein [Nocardioides mesophilus]QNN51177.1 TetR/AcrR family transcriptional regulator C-terminal domain-containing protein [Nocardioides mesophilus]
MSDPAGETRPRGPGLSRERVLRSAVEVADAGGIAALTIRSLADALGVRPMSVYHYVANKEEILDGLVDIVFDEIELPTVGGDWRAELSRRAHSARQVLRRHPWAIPLLESRRSPGPATLRHHDAVLGTLRAAGFSPEGTAHAYVVLDAFVYGYAVQESSLPFEGTDGVGEMAAPIVELMSAGAYPHLLEMTTAHYLRPGYDFAEEFQLGLDLVLDGLVRWSGSPSE